MLRSTSKRHVTRAASRISSRATATLNANSALAAQRLAIAEKLASPQGLRFFSSYSSFREPGSLFQVTPLDESTDDISPSPVISDRDAPLRADVRTMGSLLGQIIREHHGDAIFEKIEEFRGLAKKWREAGAGRDSAQADTAKATFDELSRLCAELSDEELLIISRAFTHFLAIANSAEAHHRIRLLNKSESDYALPDKTDSCAGVLQSLTEQGKSPDEIFEALSTQQTELVLTAHPTEVNRRVILEKQRRVQQVSHAAKATMPHCYSLSNSSISLLDLNQSRCTAREIVFLELCPVAVGCRYAA